MIEGQISPAASSQAPGTQPPPGELVAGMQLGKYEILQRLASGGMAEIFLARMIGVLGFDKLVVIKRILPHLAQRNDFIQMFLDEARIGTTLNHGNICQTHEVGVHGKSYFMVMEYLAGEDVRTVVRRIGREEGGRLPLEHALNIAVGVAAGLQYAHEKKDRDGKPLDIVHRDVTPQNVIVTWDGAVKLLDFGIAKASNRINETRSGSFKGKVPYMSPEQCRGEPLDRRSDIFSLGILLHEMTLCRRLFRGETDFQILKQIAEGPITRPSEIDAGYDARLEAIVMKALERDPAARFQTARELQQALEELAHDRRLRLSPLSLADYMHALFGDKINAFQSATADADPAKLEAHFATIFAERDADLAAEEGAPPAHYDTGPPPSEVQLSRLDDLRPQRKVGARTLLALALVAAAVVGAWRYRDRVLPPSFTATTRPVPTVGTAAPASRPRELPAPNSDNLAPAPANPTLIEAAAVMEVSTVPPGADLVLDGKELSQRSPARLEVKPDDAHVLFVHLAGQKGVAQRFTLGAGEEASMEIDLRRGSHPVAKPLAHLRPRAHAPVAAAPASSPPPTPPVAARPQGDGTLVVATSPWCNVTVDGQPRGTTPLSLKLKAGPHSVALSNSEFHISRTLAVDVQPNQTVRKSLDFAPE